MGQTIKLGGKEYDVESLSDGAIETSAALQFINKRIHELNNMQALLQRAKKSYVDSLKKEMLSNKAGFLLEDD